MSSARPSSGYPFVTKRQVIERLDRDPSFVRECVEILHRRHVDRDLLEPPAGWMSSHRKLGEDLHSRLGRADCTDADLARAATLTKRYAKQITKVLRDEQLARDPRLALAAAVFGVSRSDEGADPLDAGDDPYAEVDEEDLGVTEPSEPPPVPPIEEAADASARRARVGEDSVRPASAALDVAAVRRRGRPKGSRNRPKADARPSKPPKKRRRG